MGIYYLSLSTSGKIYKQTKNWTFFFFLRDWFSLCLFIFYPRRPSFGKRGGSDKSYQHFFFWWQTSLQDNLVWSLYFKDRRMEAQKISRNYRSLMETQYWNPSFPLSNPVLSALCHHMPLYPKMTLDSGITFIYDMQAFHNCLWSVVLMLNDIRLFSTVLAQGQCM